MNKSVTAKKLYCRVLLQEELIQERKDLILQGLILIALGGVGDAK